MRNLSLSPYPLVGSKRSVGMEATTVSCANAGHERVNFTTVILGATKTGAETSYNFDGMSLAQATVRSLQRGAKGYRSFNPLTQKECVLRVIVACIRCDAPMVRSAN